MEVYGEEIFPKRGESYGKDTLKTRKGGLRDTQRGDPVTVNDNLIKDSSRDTRKCSLPIDFQCAMRSLWKM